MPEPLFFQGRAEVCLDHSQGYLFVKSRKFLLLGKIPENPPDEADISFGLSLCQEKIIDNFSQEITPFFKAPELIKLLC